MDKYLNLISQSALFSSIEKKDIVSLLGCLQSTIVHYSKASYIWNAGMKVNQIGIVLEGKLQVARDNILGDHTILMEVGIAELFGEAYAYISEDLLPVSVIAKEDSTILFLNSKNIIHACSKLCHFHYQITENLLSIIVQKNIQLNQKNEILSSRNIHMKLLTYLSILTTKTGDQMVEIPFNRQELADYLAVNRSALSTELTKLKSLGYIDYYKNTFILKKSPAEEIIRY